MRVDAGVRSPGVSGRLTAPAALRLLLAGTGHRATFRDAASVVVGPAAEGAVSAQALLPVRVSAG